ncbi:PorT family protein [Maribacter algarum]|uniref:PorT family protein n=1 Tax=Maribacter algarum (ex Zhang et al. 2020) TaxID=2578118 RepID=A0A5S3PTP3_9FLAO|nr:porin family protein [Maribacter algarum]TMM58333.1 PorT family protein [Maribacter algarum]
MRQYVLWLLIIVPFSMFSQAKQDTTTVNPRYFEDQFYAGVTYNFILNLPGEEPNKANQRDFSYGLQVGFIKDIPLNNDRTFGVGLGLGLGLYTYYTNIRAIENGNDIAYLLVQDVDDFKRSKLETHLVEVPLEFRWRNSNPEIYSFWRIYAGVKFGYVFNARSKYVLADLKESFQNTDVRNFQYGLTFNFGYHNFNMHAYYSLTGLFNNGVTLDENNIEMSPLRIGLVFYVL